MFQHFFRKAHTASLKNKMILMLLMVLVQNMFFAGLITLFGSLYLRSFDQILDDCYRINQLLNAYTAEAADFGAYVLHRDATAYSAYLNSRSESDQARFQIVIPFEESSEQYLLLQGIATSYGSFHEACDETVLLRASDGDYALAYEKALRIGGYIERYIKELQQIALSRGQAAYRRDMVKFQMLPAIFLVSVALSLVSIALWTRWMVKRVVSPINALIKTAAAMSENQYDTPDIPASEEDEISKLTHMVNRMKHSTARLVESLTAQREIENRLHEEELRRMKMEATMDTLRLSLLQSQINPHFLFNTLNIISRMAQMEQAPATEELIVRLANLFRYNLQSTDDIVPLSNELKIVEDYIAIQQIRFGERIKFSLALGLDPARFTVPVFTLQPLIENAVIHGIGPMEAGGEVLVRILQTESHLTISVRDTGVGMSAEQLDALLQRDADAKKHVTGLGIGNVRARIETHYPGSSFVVDSRVGEGTNILISIPIEEVCDRDV